MRMVSQVDTEQKVIVETAMSAEGFKRDELPRPAGNDPSQSQYQLWIFGTAQHVKYPVDGGVFDIPPERRKC